MHSTDILTREQLALIPTPAGTASHKPVPHIEVINALVETLGFRNIGIVNDQYAVSGNGAKMFGAVELATNFNGCRFAIGVRNSHDKSMRLAMVAGYCVIVCDNLFFQGDCQSVSTKHSKNFSLVSAVAVGVEMMQRNFDGMVKQVEVWKGAQLSDNEAKLLIYEAFVEGELSDYRVTLLRDVHDHYFNPRYPEFEPRTLWSLSNAFTSAAQALNPILQFKATAAIGEFFADRVPSRTIDVPAIADPN